MIWLGIVGLLLTTTLTVFGCGGARMHEGVGTPPARTLRSPPELDGPPPPMVERWLAPSWTGSAGRFRVGEGCAGRVSELLGRMTLDEKLGQLIQPDRSALRNPEEIRAFFLGSVLSGGGSGPQRNEPLAWRAMVEGYEQMARRTPRGIPLLYGIDAVHGHNNVKGATIFPHPIGLGCSRDPALVEAIGAATAAEVAATGIRWSFAPVVAAARDLRWGRTYEAFGESSELAELLGPALIRGLQGARLGQRPTSVLACAKHFVGDGGTHGGRDRGNTVVTAEQLLLHHLRQYQAAIDAGVGSVMASYSSVNGVMMHEHRALLTDMLRTQMGFSGILVSDYAALERLPGNYAEQVERALLAGIDMVMGPNDFRALARTLRRLAGDRIPMSRIDEAVSRVLSVKCELGLFESARPTVPLSVLGSGEHRALARRAVAASAVLLKNDNALLPLAKSSGHLLVLGKSADDLGRQCGGWTIEWQGAEGPITEGTTILQGIRRALGPGARLSVGSAKDADVAVVVIGERPYAEAAGDNPNPVIDPADLALVEAARATSRRVVVVLVTGRPLVLGRVKDLADALLVVWLPGSEGQGVADVLFGDVPPGGKLSHTWPKDVGQLPFDPQNTAKIPEYPYGMGLAMGPMEQVSPPVDQSKVDP